MGKRGRKKPSPAALKKGREGVLRCVPRIQEGVESREEASGLIQLRRTFGARRGFTGALAWRLGLRRRIRANLDEAGSFFWRQIDGVQTVSGIAQRVRKRCGCTKREAEEAALTFSRMLLTRHFIYLWSPGTGVNGGMS